MDDLPSPPRSVLLFHACHGRTSTGDAYRATLSRPGGSDRQVHVLVLDARVDPRSPAIARLQSEVRALASTRIPALQSVLELAQSEGRVVVLSELFDARDLGSLLTDGLPLRALLDVLGEVAAALDTAWNALGPDGAQLRLVHQDVRPGTLLVGRHGDVRLAEFGLGRALSADLPGGEHSHWLYMAPERFTKGADHPAADIYSLGNILYEGIVGRHPFYGKTFTELYPYMRDPVRAEEWLAEQLAGLPFDVPPAVEALVTGMLAVDPQRRPTAREVSRECDRISDQVSGFPLKRWARERQWPPQPTVPAPLVGREVPVQPLHQGGGAGTPPIAPPALLPSVAPEWDPLDAPGPKLASSVPVSSGRGSSRTGTPAPVSA
ncbi:MAG: protein kinase, partial [Deltaproteobacteria bacterium]|nr:protein kinase [Deltaproteobacteria bacterium]